MEENDCFSSKNTSNLSEAAKRRAKFSIGGVVYILILEMHELVDSGGTLA